MANFFVSTRIVTNKSLEAVFDITEAALRRLGGQIKKQEDGFEVINGKNGLSFFSALASIRSKFSIRKLDHDYLIEASIQRSTGGLFWGLFVVGLFCFFIINIFNILYFFVDPTESHQKVLDQIQNDLQISPKTEIRII